MIKKVIQQGRSHLDARSVLPVREYGKMARTPLVFFPIFPFRCRLGGVFGGGGEGCRGV